MVLAGNLAYAQESVIPPRPSPPKLVNDLADVMNADQEARLEQKLEAFDRETSIPIVVVTINTLDGREVHSYNLELAQKWQAGDKEKDNGVVILAAIKDRKMNIAVGYGMEGVLPDGLASRIIKNEIAPSFKEGNYYEGFNKGTDAIIKVSKGEYKNDKKQEKKGKGGTAGIIIFIIIIIIIAIRKGGGNNRGGRYMSRGGAGDFMTGWIIGSLLNSGGRSSGGWGGSGGSSGGDWGGSGFGGGDFGGGGASGGW
jgi:uncharacterized protein